MSTHDENHCFEEKLKWVSVEVIFALRLLMW